jgi:hypothetical protein
MTKQKVPTDEPLINHERKGEWLQMTPGEHSMIFTSFADTGGAFTTLEVVADHRNGRPMHIHLKEDMHFIILEGMSHMVCGDQILGAAGRVLPSGAASTRQEPSEPARDFHRPTSI